MILSEAKKDSDGEESVMAMVIGVARHKVWLQSPKTGKVYGITEDLISQSFDSGFLRVKPSSTSDICSSEADFDENVSNSDDASYDFTCPNVVMNFMRKLKWSAFDDCRLIFEINSYSASLGRHPLQLNYTQLRSFSTALAPSFHRGFLAMDIFLRINIILFLNDTAAPLLPFIYSPQDSTNNASVVILSVLRSHLLFTVKEALLRSSLRLSEASIGCAECRRPFRVCFPVSKMQSSSEGNDFVPLGTNDASQPQRTFPLVSEMIKLSGIFKASVEEEGIGVTLQNDDWQLKVALHTSFLGQLVAFLRRGGICKDEHEEEVESNGIDICWKNLLLEGIQVDEGQRLPFLVASEDSSSTHREAFDAFMSEAFFQIQRLFDGDLMGTGAETLSVERVSLLLDTFQSIGLMIGLAYRYEVKVAGVKSLKLPHWLKRSALGLKAENETARADVALRDDLYTALVRADLYLSSVLLYFHFVGTFTATGLIICLPRGKIHQRT